MWMHRLPQHWIEQYTNSYILRIYICITFRNKVILLKMYILNWSDGVCSLWCKNRIVLEKFKRLVCSFMLLPPTFNSRVKGFHLTFSFPLCLIFFCVKWSQESHELEDSLGNTAVLLLRWRCSSEAECSPSVWEIVHLILSTAKKGRIWNRKLLTGL